MHQGPALPAIFTISRVLVLLLVTQILGHTALADSGSAAASAQVGESQLSASNEHRGIHLVSLSFQQDFLILKSSRAACSGGSSYDCYYGDGVYYDTEPFAPDDSSIDFAGNEISSGFATATGRLLLNYERRLSQRLGIGIGLGWAFGYRNVPAQLSPIHIEARGNYYFGDPAAGGFAPFVGLAGGLAQSAAFQSLVVYEPSTQDPVTGETPETELEAWTNPGPAFLGLSLGALIPVGGGFDLSAEGRLAVHFPEYGFAPGLKAGIARAF